MYSITDIINLFQNACRVHTAVNSFDYGDVDRDFSLSADVNDYPFVYLRKTTNVRDGQEANLNFELHTFALPPREAQYVDDDDQFTYNANGLAEEDLTRQIYADLISVINDGPNAQTLQIEQTGPAVEISKSSNIKAARGWMVPILVCFDDPLIASDGAFNTTIAPIPTTTGIFDRANPPGGATGQVLTKDSPTDYDYSWKNSSAMLPPDNALRPPNNPTEESVVGYDNNLNVRWISRDDLQGRDGNPGAEGAQGPYIVRLYQAVPSGDPVPTTPVATYDGGLPYTNTNFTLLGSWSTVFPAPTPQTDEYTSFAEYNPENDTLGGWSVAHEVGTQGPAGPPGTAGANGSTWHSGTVPPATNIGVDGDFYIDRSDDRIYGPKASGAWGTGFSIRGMMGLPGTNGMNGTAGESIDGVTVVSGGQNPGQTTVIQFTSGGSNIGPQITIQPGTMGTGGGGGGISGVNVEDEGITLATAATTLNFEGAGVTATGTGTDKTITIPGGGSGVTVEDEGVALANPGTLLNFTGANVTASGTGAEKTINVSDPTNAQVDSALGISSSGSATQFLNQQGDFATPATGGGGNPLTIEDEGTALTTAATTLNFVGAGVEATGTGGEKTITISGGDRRHEAWSHTQAYSMDDIVDHLGGIYQALVDVPVPSGNPQAFRDVSFVRFVEQPNENGVATVYAHIRFTQDETVNPSVAESISYRFGNQQRVLRVQPTHIEFNLPAIGADPRNWYIDTRDFTDTANVQPADAAARTALFGFNVEPLGNFPAGGRLFDNQSVLVIRGPLAGNSVPGSDNLRWRRTNENVDINQGIDIFSLHLDDIEVDGVQFRTRFRGDWNAATTYGAGDVVITLDRDLFAVRSGTVIPPAGSVEAVPVTSAGFINFTSDTSNSYLHIVMPTEVDPNANTYRLSYNYLGAVYTISFLGTNVRDISRDPLMGASNEFFIRYNQLTLEDGTTAISQTNAGVANMVVTGNLVDPQMTAGTGDPNVTPELDGANWERIGGTGVLDPERYNFRPNEWVSWREVNGTDIMGETTNVFRFQTTPANLSIAANGDVTTSNLPTAVVTALTAGDNPRIIARTENASSYFVSSVVSSTATSITTRAVYLKTDNTELIGQDAINTLIGVTVGTNISMFASLEVITKTDFGTGMNDVAEWARGNRPVPSSGLLIAGTNPSFAGFSFPRLNIVNGFMVGRFASPADAVSFMTAATGSATGGRVSHSIDLTLTETADTTNTHTVQTPAGLLVVRPDDDGAMNVEVVFELLHFTIDDFYAALGSPTAGATVYDIEIGHEGVAQELAGGTNVTISLTGDTATINTTATPTTFGSDAGDVATWAEGNNDDLVPADKYVHTVVTADIVDASFDDVVVNTVDAVEQTIVFEADDQAERDQILTALVGRTSGVRPSNSIAITFNNQTGNTRAGHTVIAPVVGEATQFYIQVFGTATDFTNFYGTSASTGIGAPGETTSGTMSVNHTGEVNTIVPPLGSTLSNGNLTIATAPTTRELTVNGVTGAFRIVSLVDAGSFFPDSVYLTIAAMGTAGNQNDMENAFRALGGVVHNASGLDRFTLHNDLQLTFGATTIMIPSGTQIITSDQTVDPGEMTWHFPDGQRTVFRTALGTETFPLTVGTTFSGSVHTLNESASVKWDYDATSQIATPTVDTFILGNDITGDGTHIPLDPGTGDEVPGFYIPRVTTSRQHILVNTVDVGLSSTHFASTVAEYNAVMTFVAAGDILRTTGVFNVPGTAAGFSFRMDSGTGDNQGGVFTNVGRVLGDATGFFEVTDAGTVRNTMYTAWNFRDTGNRIASGTAAVGAGAIGIICNFEADGTTPITNGGNAAATEFARIWNSISKDAASPTSARDIRAEQGTSANHADWTDSRATNFISHSTAVANTGLVTLTRDAGGPLVGTAVALGFNAGIQGGVTPIIGANHDTTIGDVYLRNEDNTGWYLIANNNTLLQF